MEKILVIGSTVTDVNLFMDHLPAAEEDVIPYRQKMTLGGCAYNVSNVLRIFGVPYTLFSPVGTGVYGRFVRDHLQRLDIVPAIETLEENGCCYCLNDAQGNRSFMSLHGAEYRFKKEWLDRIDTKQYGMAYVCGLELEEPCNDVIIAFLQENPGLKVIYAPGPRVGYIPSERSRQMLEICSYLHCNARELRVLTGEENVPEGLKRLPERISAVVTDGDKDVCIFEKGIIRTEPAVRAAVVSGTGAGDAHCGAVMAMLAKGENLTEAVRMANKVGARAVQSEESAVSEKDLEDLL